MKNEELSEKEFAGEEIDNPMASASQGDTSSFIPHASFFIFSDFVVLVQGGVVEHGRADAELAVLGHQDVVVDATFASLPEGLVVGQLVEGDGHISQLGIHFHDGSTRSQTKNLGVRPAHTGQLEGHLLDSFGNAQSSKVGMHDQAGGGHILFVTPRLDIAETCKFVTF